MKAKLGRPRIPKRLRKRNLTVCVTPAEKREIKHAARQAEISVSDFLLSFWRKGRVKNETVQGDL